MYVNLVRGFSHFAGGDDDEEIGLDGTVDVAATTAKKAAARAAKAARRAAHRQVRSLYIFVFYYTSP